MTFPNHQQSEESELLSTDILKAQSEADAVVDSAEAEEMLAPIPRMLELDQTELVNKTRELKARGEQLDLLLLKAESYSHFIQMNQEQNDRATRAMLEKQSKKRRRDDGETEASATSSDEPCSMSAMITKQPPNLVGGTLKPYQLDGLRWLVSLWENGLSGILGDEMGLGKTIQVISLIAHLRTTNTSGPFLIAGPLATLPNWMSEFNKWLPSCPVLLYHGDKATRARLRRERLPVGGTKTLSFPVVVTSFEMCMVDRPHLERYEWQYIILDEGHRIKNRNCRLVRELKQLRSVSRLLLTGTPIQNTLEELWALLNFVNPRIFDSLEVFQAWFGFRNIGRDTQVEDIIGGERRERLVSKLHEILRPFLLRRMKRDVLLTLPAKKEIVVYCPLTALQREYYAHAQQRHIKEFLASIGLEGGSNENTTMQLRKVCQHPFLFGEPRDERGQYIGEAHPHLLVMASGKLQLLDRMLARLQRDGHRVLLFSQFTSMLDILQDYCAYRGYKLCRLDGSTKLADRQESIEAFNSDRCIFIFLLSTRAGGLGINLTGADTIILFDSDWNPHQDAQAQDRCHRIGQLRNVVAYRLLTAGSVEIEMMEKQISKKKLERLAIVGGDFSKVGMRKEGSGMSLARLRRLLEDDVKNLSRMTGAGELSDLLSEEAATAAASSISKHELELIMNRHNLFDVMLREGPSGEVAGGAHHGTGAASSSSMGGVIPLEGDMYDILSVTATEPAFLK